MFQAEDFTLFFSMPPSLADWSNVQASGVTQIMLPWDVATERVLADCAKMGLSVILRLPESQAASIQPGELQGGLRERMEWGHIKALILGVEPDAQWTWTWGAEWGLNAAWQHQARVEALYYAVKDVGPKVISPGWVQRGFVETDPPEPGLISWREITAPVYNQMDGNGVHLYGFGWGGQHTDRFLHQVRWWGSLRHKGLWIDEANMVYGSQVERMTACLGMARLLRDTQAGERVEMFSPFLSNGTGVSYDPAFIMRDPACYMLVRLFMEGE